MAKAMKASSKVKRHQYRLDWGGPLEKVSGLLCSPLVTDALLVPTITLIVYWFEIVTGLSRFVLVEPA